MTGIGGLTDGQIKVITFNNLYPQFYLINNSLFVSYKFAEYAFRLVLKTVELFFEGTL